MSFRFFLLATLCNLFAFVSSAQVNDSFTDGDFTTNPTWSGDVTQWLVTSGELQSNGAAVTPDTNYLSTPSTIAEGQWEFFVNPKTSTSSGNYAEVHLMSDNANLEAPHNGYFVRIGDTQDDVSLWRKSGTTQTKIIDGTDLMIASSSDNPTKVKVLRNASSDWTLYADATGTGNNYVLIGNVNDATFLTSSFFGVLVKHSSATFDKYFFDDLYAGPAIVDNTPPSIVSATVIDATHVDVLFNEALESGSAQTVTNYLIDNGIGNPTAANVDGTNPALIHLTLATPLINGQSYQLLVNNIQDVNGNTLVTGSTNFTYSVASGTDVIINELMVDPSPVVGLPDAEFIELYNRGTEDADITGWKLTDGTSTATLPTYTLPANGYVIITSTTNAALFSAFPNVIGVGSFPSLNNSGDLIQLLMETNALVDEVTFTVDWYNNAVKAAGGWTLERINPNSICNGGSNWTASNDLNGGTPGTQNSVFNNTPDTQGPQVISALVVNPNNIKLAFDEPVDSSIATTLTNYSVDNSIGSPTAVIINSVFDTITLSLASSLVENIDYTVTISNMTDCSGNVVASQSIQVSLGAAALTGDVVINELFPDPDPAVGLPNVEFIELYNRTANDIDVTNWVLSDGSSNGTFSNHIIPANSYLIVTSTTNQNLFTSFGEVLGISSFPSLNNSDDVITLKNASGLVVDKVAYSDSWYNDDAKQDGGWTLERINPNKLCGGASNWTASENSQGGTPGTQNSNFDSTPDTNGPQIIAVTVPAADTIVIQFDEVLDSLTATEVIHYTIDSGIGNPVSVSVASPDLNVVTLLLSQPLAANITYTLTITNLADCALNETNSQSLQLTLPDTAAPGDVVINEILYNPVSAGFDYVEIYNRSDKTIDASQLKLWNTDINGEADQSTTLSNTSRLIQPGEFLLATEDTAWVIHNYPFHNDSAFVEIDDLHSYNDDEGTVILTNAHNAVIDRLTYYDDWQFPLLDITEGVSLERISVHEPTQDSMNWHSAATAIGYGTPGLPNSQRIHSFEHDDVEIELVPKVFSPDQDGYNDVLTINYHFGSNGYVLNVKIFNEAGALVTDLVNGRLAEGDGFATWDGTDSRNERAAVGPYVIWIEAFKTDGTVKYFKKTCILAGKK